MAKASSKRTKAKASRQPAEAKAELSKRQAQALAAVRKFQAEHGFPPTRAELGRLLGVRAQTADFHLRALQRKGYLSVSRQARGLRLEGAAEGHSQARKDKKKASPSARLAILPHGGGEAAEIDQVPILGRVAAGDPLAALENVEGRLPLPGGAGVDFALRVQGDSMIEDGIFDGDLVLVQQTKTAAKGEIVVALLGEGEAMEATVKRYLPQRRQVVLRPANAAMKDIVVPRGESFALAGRVVGVLRLWK